MTKPVGDDRISAEFFEVFDNEERYFPIINIGDFDDVHGVTDGLWRRQNCGCHPHQHLRRMWVRTRPLAIPRILLRRWLLIQLVMTIGPQHSCCSPSTPEKANYYPVMLTRTPLLWFVFLQSLQSIALQIIRISFASRILYPTRMQTSSSILAVPSSPGHTRLTAPTAR